MNKERLFLYSLIGILMIGIGILGVKEIERHRQKNDTAYNPQVPVLPVVTLKPTDVTVEYPFIGRVIPVHFVDVVPHISGYVDKIDVTGGSFVHAGDVLFQIRSDEFKARRDLAAADVLKAEADLRNAERYLKRVQQTKSNALSQTEIDQAEANYLAAKGTYKAAEANLSLARIEYDYTRVTAPIDGIVGYVNISPGDYISPESEDLIRVIQYHPIRVVFSLSDKEYLAFVTDSLHFFNQGTVRLRLANGQLYPYVGQIRFLNNEITSQTSSISAYADFPNPDNVLLSNAFVRVLFEQTFQGALLVKDVWVELTEQGAFLTVLRKGKVMRVSVVLAPAGVGQYRVVSGVYPDDAVVTVKVSADQIGRPAQAQPEHLPESETGALK